MEVVIPNAASLGLFMAAVLALLLTPGPAVLYIMTRSVEQGRKAGLVSVLGIHVGTLVHIAAATAGLSALLASSALGFAVVKYAGAAYLVYLGVRKLMSKTTGDGIEVAPSIGRAELGRAFRDGVVVNVLNPKTALFFLAFLPQFVDLSRGAVPFQIAFLGLLFAVMGLVSDGAFALAAGTAGRWMRRHRHFLSAERYASGFTYIGLGVTAALTGNGRT
jgi:threonine/homoserine/homoserine lactone efflux protein